MKTSDYVEISIILFILALSVYVVDEPGLRVGVSLIPALLLAQRSFMNVRVSGEAAAASPSDRRSDGETRTAVDQLLWQVREFYLTCHLMGSGKMSSEQAVERTAQLEKELNKILAMVTDGAKVRAGRSSTVGIKS